MHASLQSMKGSAIRAHLVGGVKPSARFTTRCGALGMIPSTIRSSNAVHLHLGKSLTRATRKSMDELDNSSGSGSSLDAESLSPLKIALDFANSQLREATSIREVLEAKAQEVAQVKSLLHIPAAIDQIAELVSCVRWPSKRKRLLSSSRLMQTLLQMCSRPSNRQQRRQRRPHQLP